MNITRLLLHQACLLQWYVFLSPICSNFRSFFNCHSLSSELQYIYAACTSGTCSQYLGGTWEQKDSRCMHSGDKNDSTMEASISLLNQRVRELEQLLAAQRAEEQRRMALLSESIRQELCFMVDIDHTLRLTSDEPLNDQQRQLLGRVSESGRQILALVKEYCEDLPDFAKS